MLSRFQGTVMSVPRCYFDSAIDSAMLYSLHGFCDASAAAYAAVVYLCAGKGLSCFVASNTRVSPLTKQTIPRLELFLARLITHVLAALGPVIRYSWDHASQIPKWQCFGSRVKIKSGNNLSTIE